MKPGAKYKTKTQENGKETPRVNLGAKYKIIHRTLMHPDIRKKPPG